MNTRVSDWIGSNMTKPGKAIPPKGGKTQSLQSNKGGAQTQSFEGIMALLSEEVDDTQAHSVSSMTEADEKEAKDQKVDESKEKTKETKTKEPSSASITTAEVKIKAEGSKSPATEEKKDAVKQKTDASEGDAKTRQQAQPQNKLTLMASKNTEKGSSKGDKKDAKVAEKNGNKKIVSLKTLKAAAGEQKEESTITSTGNKFDKKLKVDGSKQKVKTAPVNKADGSEHHSLAKNVGQDKHQPKEVILQTNTSSNKGEGLKEAAPLQGLKKPEELPVIKFSGKEVLGKETQQVKGEARQHASAPSQSVKTAKIEGFHPATNTKSSTGGLTFLSFKNSSPGEAAPGKMFFIEKPVSADLNMHMDHFSQFKDHSGKSFKEVQMNNLGSSHLAEAAGRKAFTKQLVQQVSRQQFSRSQSAAKQTSAWKHQRVVLKDGKAIHIAARSSDGVLQLQLNAGSGKLGKLLQQHLHEIQQHVQQQLNVEIDLQLKDQGSQQGAYHESSSSPSTTPQNHAPGREKMILSTQAERRQVRYFGFNRNEWTA